MADPANLNRLTYFAAVVETGSFTAAGQRLGITKAVVSQQVARLESEVGATLLVRTTRQVRPTETGRSFYARCRVILSEAEAAFGEMAQNAETPNGLLRITAPSDYGVLVVAPVVSAFVARFPSCRAELKLTDERVNLIDDELDVGIRVGWLKDSSQQTRRVGTFDQLVVCAPSTAKTLPKTLQPNDLSTLGFVANSALPDPFNFTFSRGTGERKRVRLNGAVSVDATLGVLAAVRGSNAFSILPDYLAAPEIKAGKLARMLPQWRLPAGGIHTLFPAARFRPVKVAAFTQMLVEAEKIRTS